MSIFQTIATLFALFMMYVTRLHKKQLLFSAAETFFWYSLWSIFIIIALFPNLLIGVTQLLHFSRVFDLLIVLSLMILTVIVVLSFFHQRETAQKWEIFIRRTAFKNATKHEKIRKIPKNTIQKPQRGR